MCLTLAGCGGGGGGSSNSDPNDDGGKTDIQLDTDKDGIIDELDKDDDNDGILDEDDVFPLDKNEHVDTDGDGIGNNADTDDDGDGVTDNEDAYPLDPTRFELPPVGPTYDLTISDAAASEQDGFIVFNMALSAAAESDMTFSYSLSDGTAIVSEDIENTANTVVFYQGQTQQSLSIAIKQDDKYECDESFVLALSGQGDTKQATGTILNSGNLPTLTFTKSSDSVTEETGNFEIQVELTEASCKDTKVNLGYQFVTAQSEDIKQAEAIVIVQGDTSAALSIKIEDDSIAEDIESFNLVLQADGEAVASSELMEVTIQRSDITPILSDITLTEDSDSANFTVALPVSLSESISFPYSTSDVTATSGEDYQGIQGNITFTPNETQKTISVPLIEDEVYECLETFVLNVSKSVATATLTNGDDQGPTLSLVSNKSEVRENEGTAKIEFELDKASCGNETVRVDYQYQSASAEDISASSYITIPQGEEKVVLELPIIDDSIKEDRETLTLTFSSGAESEVVPNSFHELHILPVTEKLYSGEGYVCAQSQDNLIKCWGENYNNRFRLETPTKVIGDSFGEANKAFHVCHISLEEKKTETLVVKQAGENKGCNSHGGFYHYSGVDKNNNGTVLDDPTWNSSFCNTEDITYMVAPSKELEPGPICPAGGFTVMIGEDENGDGTLATDEMGEYLQASQFGELKVKDLFMNDHSGCVHYENGSVACWNSQSDLSISDMNVIDFGQDRKVTRFSASYNHYCAVLEDGALKCWGENTYNQLGYDFDEDLSLPIEQSIDLGHDDNGLQYSVKSVLAGSGFTCALLHDGNVKCWGSRYHPRSLGYDKGRYVDTNHHDADEEDNEMGNNLPVINLGTDKVATRLFKGQESICAQLNTNEVKCWGLNEDAQLGLGRADKGVGDRGVSTNIRFCHKKAYSFIFEQETNTEKEDCELGETQWRFGADENDNGAIDDGEWTRGWRKACNIEGQPIIFNVSSLPIGSEHCSEYGGIHIESGIDYNNDGAFNLEMGDELPPLDFGSLAEVKDLSIFDHGCVLLDDSTFKCWGDNSSGALGVEENIVWGDNLGETPATIASPNMGTDRTVKQMVLSWGLTCVLLDNTDVKCWGNEDNDGVLGNPLFHNMEIGNDENEMGDNLPPVRVY